jgi:hypothetical protein
MGHPAIAIFEGNSTIGSNRWSKIGRMVFGLVL